MLALQADRARGVGLALGEQGPGLLLVVEGREDRVGLLALIPPNVVGVLGVVVARPGGVVAVEDRPAEGRPFDAVAVGPEGVVAAGQDPLERLVGAGLAEDGDAVVLDPRRRRRPSASGTARNLPRCKGLEDSSQRARCSLERSLIVGLTMCPVVLDLRPLGIVEGEADQLALLVLQRGEEPGDGGLGRGALGVRPGRRARTVALGPRRQDQRRRRGQGGRPDGLDELAARDTRTRALVGPQPSSGPPSLCWAVG